MNLRICSPVSYQAAQLVLKVEELVRVPEVTLLEVIILKQMVL